MIIADSYKARRPRTQADSDVSVSNESTQVSSFSATASPSPVSPAPSVSMDEALNEVNTDLSKMQIITSVAVGKHAMAVRLSLFLLVRVLLKILEREGERQVRNKVQQALRYCRRKNREGDPAFRSLSMSIMKLVRAVVGEKRWRQAEMACVVVVSKKRSPSVMPTQEHVNQRCSYVAAPRESPERQPTLSTAARTTMPQFLGAASSTTPPFASTSPSIQSLRDDALSQHSFSSKKRHL